MAATRTVRHLRLRGPSEASVRRTALSLEDALRTATLPDAGGRVLLVRRLALGPMEEGAGVSSLTRVLERAVERARMEMRHGGEPGAEAAPAVWFRDALEAHTALAVRLMAGPPPGAWFWTLAVPGWRGAPGTQGLRAVILSLAARPEAPVALPRWVAEVADAGWVDALAWALLPEDVPHLRRAAGLPPDEWVGREGRPDAAAASGPRGAFSDEEVREAPPSSSSRPLDDSPGAGGDTVRRLLLALLRRAGRAPGGMGHRVAKGRGAESAGRREGGAGGNPGAPEAGAGPSEDTGTEGTSSISERRLGAGPGAARAREEAGIADRRPVEAHGSPAESSLRPTAAGGLLFLLAALDRVGYSDWVSEAPEWADRGVAHRVLGAVLDRLGIAPEDPVRATVVPAVPHRPGGPPPRSFVAPPGWWDGLLSGEGPVRLTGTMGGGRLHDASGRLVLAAWSGDGPSADVRSEADGAPQDAAPSLPDVVAGAWGIALRRWTRRFARIGLADLVLRPARISVTPTHADVHLHLRRADLRVRKAGLDLDPGWLPWMGRVVTFHYGREER